MGSMGVPSLGTMLAQKEVWVPHTVPSLEVKDYQELACDFQYKIQGDKGSLLCSLPLCLVETIRMSTIMGKKKVKVSNGREMAKSERNLHSKTEVGN